MQAILMSLVRSASNVYVWTNTRIFLMLLFILPFVWVAVRNMEIRFRYPLLFTFLTFGVYASQATHTMYVFGILGDGRIVAILYYSYIIWLVGNVVYWVGWLCRRTGRFREYLDKTVEKLQKYLVVYINIVQPENN